MPQLGFEFSNSYAALPEKFYSPQLPSPVKKPELIRVNHALAKEMNLDPIALESSAGVQVLAGNQIPVGANPISTVYAGHQFGMWNPQLGDGRAILLGEVISQSGQRLDVQLKGSGTTPYSRMGDGRSPLGPVLREYIVSEAMFALGIPTTRSLAAVTTGEQVARDTLLPGAILTRIAKSHIRVGTFEFFASRGDTDSLITLADHVIDRHYPDAKQADNPYQALLECVIDAQASLIARWQGVGFIHGVMNTDNMLLCGQTVDYGPCAFMDNYHPATCFSSIDQHKRYAYGNQPQIAHWNLTCLAQCLLLIMDANETRALKMAQKTVDLFPGKFAHYYLKTFRAKLGLQIEDENDQDLILQLLEQMEQNNLDFTLTFRHLADRLCSSDIHTPLPDSVFTLPESFQPWLNSWEQRVQQETLSPQQRQKIMYAANPAIIPRNHQVEEAINAAQSSKDFKPFHELVDALSTPHQFDPSKEKYIKPPMPDQVVEHTFCGT